MTTIENPGRYLNNELLFRDINDPGPVGKIDDSPADETDADAEKSILCRTCRVVITDNKHAVAINGSHAHTFFNPSGIVYEIRCFNKARGSILHGKPTDEFSWFKGYVWQFALCANCLAHLGWGFQSPDKFFVGLIANKIVEG